MENVTISRIRPVSWMIVVQGKEEAQYVCNMLRGMRMEVSEPREQPSLVDPALYSFTVTSKPEVPITTEEIEALLERDERITLAFSG